MVKTEGLGSMQLNFESCGKKNISATSSKIGCIQAPPLHMTKPLLFMILTKECAPHPQFVCLPDELPSNCRYLNYE